MHSLLRGPIAPALSMLCFGAVPASAQISFSIDWMGPTIGRPDSAHGLPITEGDVLIAESFIPELGPLAAPRILIAAGHNSLPSLGLSGGPFCTGHPAGVPCTVEVDALCFGGPNMNLPSFSNRYVFSADRQARGSGAPVPPTLHTEAPVGDLACDMLVDLGLGPGPKPPTSALAGSVAAIDGNGLRSPSGFLYPGVGLIEPSLSTSNLPNPGDNVDAIAIRDSVLPVLFPVYFSLDAAWVDPLTGIPHTGSAATHGFRPGDIIVTTPLSAGPVLYASSLSLGLDLLANTLDDVDAVVVRENGQAGYQASQTPNDWWTGATDMLLFSVRRGSSVIGRPDSIFGLPIEPGDILTTPLPNSAGGLSPYPGIYIAAENLGLRTTRSGMTTTPFGDDLNSAEIVSTPMLDCNMNGIEDAVDVAFGASSDANDNGIPDECEGDFIRFCMCRDNVAPCGNSDPTAGCANSTGSGALMSPTGTSSVAADDLRLITNGLPAGSFGLGFMGPGVIGPVPFFDGLLCAGGPHFRYNITNGGVAGVAVLGPGIVAYSQSNFPPNGQIMPGDTWGFQHWYRDTGASPCGTDVNTSSAVRVRFRP